jgi:hypothetical protein
MRDADDGDGDGCSLASPMLYLVSRKYTDAASAVSSALAELASTDGCIHVTWSFSESSYMSEARVIQQLFLTRCGCTCANPSCSTLRSNTDVDHCND